MFNTLPDPVELGSGSSRFPGAPCRVRVPVDIDDPDIARLDDRRERVLFRIPHSNDACLLKKYNLDDE